MAINDNKDSALPIGNDSSRKSADFLPRFFRTATNKKFLQATFDQLISEGSVEKINAFIGRKTTKAFSSTDSYLEDVSANREHYQLEPALVIKDSLDNVTFFKDYNDYVNQIAFFNGVTTNHSSLNSQEYYAWEPHIDWDKFINYREYYWLPNGPQSISITGKQENIISTYTVKSVNEGDNYAFVFTPDGLKRNPSLRLYRGETYRFDIDSPGQPIAIKSVRLAGDGNTWDEGVDTQFVEKGIIEFTVPVNAPPVLYYVSKNDVNASGLLKIYDITEATSIDVDAEIIGKKTFQLSDGTALSNGMKVFFQGNVKPEKYATGFWYVEGVGTAIQLIANKDLEVPASYTYNDPIEFDNEYFDTQGFDVNNNFPAIKDYITINRASKDRNPWTRYNRWFHKSVVEASAIVNGQDAILDQSARATRPIIEFNAGLELWNFGKSAKANINLVDNYTTDVFSTLEGATGFYVDEVAVTEGDRILFTADTDVRVNGRIFKVKFITHLNQKQITLVPEDDTDPIEGETVLVLNGKYNKGKMYHYTNGNWVVAQSKEAINQKPLFNVVDITGVSFGDKTKYIGSSFAGSTVFEYRPGNNLDAELGFNVTYRNIGNIGDLVFDYTYHSDAFTYQDVADVPTVKVDSGYLVVNDGLASTSHVNGWTTAYAPSVQPVIRQYVVETFTNFFPIDVYDDITNLADSDVKVYLNGKRQTILDYNIYRQDGKAYVNFFTERVVGDNIIIKCYANIDKNSNGYYEFPNNLQYNPKNINVEDFTLGEITDHVYSIVDNIDSFVGALPGPSNLRDLGNVSKYGTKIIQSSGTLTPVMFHLTSKDYNVINSLRYAKQEYSKFKRNFIRTATEYGFDGVTRVHFDLIMKEMCKDKTKDMPFYLSDMVPYGPATIFEQELIDDSITAYPITFDFDLTNVSSSAVLVYLNDEILIHGRDYEFVDTNFVQLIKTFAPGDNLKVIQYEKTYGCFVPPTPSKLGLFPLYRPEKFRDNTYTTPTNVIRGHDGSITVAFDDYRDDLLLELETRIYNNVKVSYNPKLFNIHDYLPGYFRESKVSLKNFNAAIRQEFLKWSRFVSDDYTKHNFYDVNNTFTYNYNRMSAPNGDRLLGFWRGIYNYVYDTDSPHLRPWECLGFSEEPLWWETVYGPAPYTKDNLILWEDISTGTIREPGKPLTYKTQFARSSILSHIPVSAEGTLLSPLDSNFAQEYVQVFTQNEFVFGDQSPVETAWRRSAEYPFAVLTALTLLKPAEVFATCFDRVRQFRDDTGQIVYKTSSGHKRFGVGEIVVPNTSEDTTETLTAGLVNYIVDYTTSKFIKNVLTYKTNLENIEVKIASKLGGFTSKEKFKLILDSRTPLNQGNVFVPDENYQIFLNTSTPVLSITYSGVIIEKVTGGYAIKGYSGSTPEFNYYKPIETASDPVINIGGISESFLDWDNNKFYSKGKVVRYDNGYYRVTTSHESGSTFESKYFSKLPKLPVTGGRDAIFRRSFETDVSALSYGTQLETIQDVVDFILGYGKWLEDQGFVFDYFNQSLSTVNNWSTSAKEFMFWTTQNWSIGSVITLSPASDELRFRTEYAVVDNIYDNFYDYSIFKSDGQVLDPNFTNSLRELNSYTLRPRNTADGIFHAQLNLVQKEHVLVLDDVTIFNDIIYDQSQGYRQERIKVRGYRTSGWRGDFDIPGFVYDRAVVLEWTPWQDYALGETVKYKEFYYSAKNNIPGTENFDETLWYRLEGRPESKLLPNWDYRAKQFEDFYDLDTDSFDVDQQKFAQHLIGYQKREYLENIINDDVSQYKFYQGMIQEKGTQNSLSKLFDALSTADKDSLEFYEEWAIRLGQYGATSAFEEVEYILDESKFLLNPQPFELTNRIDPTVTDFVYRILPHETYIKEEGYNHAPFPLTSDPTHYLQTAGYVREEDVNFVVEKLDDILTYSVSRFREGDYIWTGYDKTSWNVYRFTLFTPEVQTVDVTGTSLKITFTVNRDPDIVVGSLIAINYPGTAFDGIGKVTDIGFNFVVAEFNKTFVAEDLGTNYRKELNVYKFTSQRLSTFNNINALPFANKKTGELVWVDGVDNNDWKVWQFTSRQNPDVLSSTGENFSKTIAVSADNTSMVVGSGIGIVAKFVGSISGNVLTVTAVDSGTIEVGHLLTNTNTTVDGIVPGTKITGFDNGTGAEGTYFVNISQEKSSTALTSTPEEMNKFYIYKRPSELQEWSFIDVVTPPINYSETNDSFANAMSLSADGSRLLVGAPMASSVSGDSTSTENEGYVAAYSASGNYYVLDRVLRGAEVTGFSNDNEYFGHKVKVVDNIAYIVAKGSTSIPGALYTFNLLTGDHIGTPFRMPSGVEVISLDVSSTHKIVIGRSDDVVHVYQRSGITVTLEQVIDLNTTGIDMTAGSLLGGSVAISSDSKKIAIGAPQYSDIEIFRGAVVILKQEETGYTVLQTLLSNANQTNERFGTNVHFNIAGDQFVVYCAGGLQKYKMLFDSGNTTFDLKSTSYYDTNVRAGSVYVYEQYDSNFIFGDLITIDNNLSEKFASSINFTNRLYINEPRINSLVDWATGTSYSIGDLVTYNRTNYRVIAAHTSGTTFDSTKFEIYYLGNIYEYANKTKSWTVFRQPVTVVDINKIKSAFLYDIETNRIIERLDFVDPIKGKILGIAEQEVSFKTHYDPATYTVSTADDEVVVDSSEFWSDTEVGKLWWDLSTTKFINPYQGITLYKANTWNTTFLRNPVDVYEWVESEYTPDQWDELADTEVGLTANISGKTKYGANVYSIRQKYDSISRTYKNLYYFWVKNKVVTPSVNFRQMSASDVARYIADPKSMGKRYISFIGPNEFSLVNCKEIISGKKVALNIRYWVADNTETNVHSHYQILAENDETGRINQYIEKKWFDSLVGYDMNNQPVPDFRLPDKLKYGVLNKPRQGMFVNRIEALKQFIERVNSVLIKQVIVDDFDISDLDSKDLAPTEFSGVYDVVKDTASELRFIATNILSRAVLTPVIENGKITKVNIVNGGRGYGTLRGYTFDVNGNPTSWYGPTININGTGTDAKLTAVVNNKGTITSVIVEKTGTGYLNSTSLTVRPFTALVNADETANDKWTLYTWDYTNNQWFRANTQQYDTTKYWEYADWYATGYNKFSKPTYEIDFAYEIGALAIQLGETVKIKNQGTGWLMLEKIDSEAFNDITVNFKVVGREKGTIQFKDNLYRFAGNNVGFDGPTFDNDTFDNQPKEELRVILNVIKNNLFIDNLALEYNKLFFASLRYVFAEQLFVDWAFKTSFVKSKHNLGSLVKKVSYQNDNLSNYEDYIREVKPYRSKVREFVSAYDKLELTRSQVTDFDLPARYNPATGKIEPIQAQINGAIVDYDSTDVLTQPYSDWLSNVGYQVIRIDIVDGGSGYKVAPDVEIRGNCTEPATAKAYIAKGKVSAIIITNKGSNYIGTPTVILNGSVDANGRAAKAVAILGDSVVRSTNIGIKFDRLSAQYQVNNMTVTQNFTGTGSKTTWDLKWPIDINTNKTLTTVDNSEQLSSDYKVYNLTDTSAGYTRKRGVLEFTNPPATGTVISISYIKDIELLDAADRIQHYYNPEAGQLGKDLGQLMTGVDYGGTEVTSYGFDVGSGWDAVPWFTTGWDSFDPDFDDFLVRADLSSTAYTLPYAPKVGEMINVYWVGSRSGSNFNRRIDDPYYSLYDGSTVQPNGKTTPAPYVMMDTFVGNGETREIILPSIGELDEGDKFIFRRTTSDGSFKPSSELYDSVISGGNLAYTTATGVRPEEITIDGDGFVTPMSSPAPEEVVPGQVVDSVNIEVLHKVTDGSARIVTRHYIADGTSNEYPIGQLPNTNQVIVKVDDLVKEQGVDYTVDFETETVTFFETLAEKTEVVVTSFSANGYNILDLDTFVADGTTTEFVTSARWSGDYTVFVTVNGDSSQQIDAFTTDSTYSRVGNIAFRFYVAPAEGSIIGYTVLSSAVDSISKVQRQDIIHDGSTSTYDLAIIPEFANPVDNSVIVEVDGLVLRPRDTIYFDVIGNNSVFRVSTVDYPYQNIPPNSVEVYVNNVLQAISADYTWISVSNELRFRKDRVSNGDEVKLIIRANDQYEISNNQITFTSSYDAGTKISINTFSNHDILEIERNNDVFTLASVVGSTAAEILKFNQFKGGRIQLRRAVISPEYVWVSINNKLLTPEVDYVLDEGYTSIKLNEKRPLLDTDIVDVVAFSSNVAKSSFGYKIFKDMLNKVHYKRIDDALTTELVEPLNNYDYKITVVDASGLATPNPAGNLPGVVIIDKERIEYFKKDGNVLSQLRRGTLGTGIKELHPVGTAVQDQSLQQTVPYADEVVSATVLADGISNTVALPFEIPVATANVSWYRDTIPNNYGQCNIVDVFVNGKRLHKTPITVFDPTVGPYSSSGDVQQEAEFSVIVGNPATETANSIRLTNAPAAGSTILVTMRVGKTWAPEDVSMTVADTDQARFIRAGQANLPL